ncbi:unnamed protein product [Pedinophyceae sp. YPF-701]|nr:unnamed protein product [Pedinophyceae sp. YPF-701]
MAKKQLPVVAGAVGPGPGGEAPVQDGGAEEQPGGAPAADQPRLSAFVAMKLSKNGKQELPSYVELARAFARAVTDEYASKGDGKIDMDGSESRTSAETSNVKARYAGKALQQMMMYQEVPPAVVKGALLALEGIQTRGSSKAAKPPKKKKSRKKGGDDDDSGDDVAPRVDIAPGEAVRSVASTDPRLWRPMLYIMGLAMAGQIAGVPPPLPRGITGERPTPSVLNGQLKVSEVQGLLRLAGDTTKPLSVQALVLLHVASSIGGAKKHIAIENANAAARRAGPAGMLAQGLTATGGAAGKSLREMKPWLKQLVQEYRGVLEAILRQANSAQGRKPKRRFLRKARVYGPSKSGQITAATGQVLSAMAFRSIGLMGDTPMCLHIWEDAVLGTTSTSADVARYAAELCLPVALARPEQVAQHLLKPIMDTVGGYGEEGRLSVAHGGYHTVGKGRRAKAVAGPFLNLELMQSRRALASICAAIACHPMAPPNVVDAFWRLLVLLCADSDPSVAAHSLRCLVGDIIPEGMPAPVKGAKDASGSALGANDPRLRARAWRLLASRLETCSPVPRQLSAAEVEKQLSKKAAKKAAKSRGIDKVFGKVAQQYEKAAGKTKNLLRPERINELGLQGDAGGPSAGGGGGEVGGLGSTEEAEQDAAVLQGDFERFMGAKKILDLVWESPKGMVSSTKAGVAEAGLRVVASFAESRACHKLALSAEAMRAAAEDAALKGAEAEASAAAANAAAALAVPDPQPQSSSRDVSDLLGDFVSGGSVLNKDTAEYLGLSDDAPVLPSAPGTMAPEDPAGAVYGELLAELGGPPGAEGEESGGEDDPFGDATPSTSESEADESARAPESDDASESEDARPSEPDMALDRLMRNLGEHVLQTIFGRPVPGSLIAILQHRSDISTRALLKARALQALVWLSGSSRPPARGEVCCERIFPMTDVLARAVGAAGEAAQWAAQQARRESLQGASLVATLGNHAVSVVVEAVMQALGGRMTAEPPMASEIFEATLVFDSAVHSPAVARRPLQDVWDAALESSPAAAQDTVAAITALMLSPGHLRPRILPATSALLVQAEQVRALVQSLTGLASPESATSGFAGGAVSTGSDWSQLRMEAAAWLGESANYAASIFSWQEAGLSLDLGRADPNTPLGDDLLSRAIRGLHTALVSSSDAGLQLAVGRALATIAVRSPHPYRNHCQSVLVGATGQGAAARQLPVASALLPMLRVLESMESGAEAVADAVARFGLDPTSWPQRSLEAVMKRHRHLLRQIRLTVCYVPEGQYYPLGMKSKPFVDAYYASMDSGPGRRGPGPRYAASAYGAITIMGDIDELEEDASTVYTESYMGPGAAAAAAMIPGAPPSSFGGSQGGAQPSVNGLMQGIFSGADWHDDDDYSSQAGVSSVTGFTAGHFSGYDSGAASAQAPAQFGASDLLGGGGESSPDPSIKRPLPAAADSFEAALGVTSTGAPPDDNPFGAEAPTEYGAGPSAVTPDNPFGPDAATEFGAAAAAPQDGGGFVGAGKGPALAADENPFGAEEATEFGVASIEKPPAIDPEIEPLTDAPVGSAENPFGDSGAEGGVGDAGDNPFGGDEATAYGVPAAAPDAPPAAGDNPFDGAPGEDKSRAPLDEGFFSGPAAPEIEAPEPEIAPVASPEPEPRPAAASEAAAGLAGTKAANTRRGVGAYDAVESSPGHDFEIDLSSDLASGAHDGASRDTMDAKIYNMPAAVTDAEPGPAPAAAAEPVSAPAGAADGLRRQASGSRAAPAAATRHGVVKYDFAAEEEGELTVAEGEELFVGQEVSGWLMCTKKRGGGGGLVPASYVDVMP